MAFSSTLESPLLGDLGVPLLLTCHLCGLIVTVELFNCPFRRKGIGSGSSTAHHLVFWCYGALVLWFCGISEETRIIINYSHRIESCFGTVLLWYYGFFPRRGESPLDWSDVPLEAQGVEFHWFSWSDSLTLKLAPGSFGALADRCRKFAGLERLSGFRLAP